MSIAGHSIDDKKYHIDYICPLFKKLFGLEPKVIVKSDRRVRYLRVRSKTITYFIKINNYYKLKGRINIPKWIFSNEIYFIWFIRGLVDTDGSLAIKKRYHEKPYYPVITITLKNKYLIEKVANFLKNHGFNLW